MSRLTSFGVVLTNAEGEIKSAFGRVKPPTTEKEIQATLDKSHAGLTRLHFTRTISEELLAGRKLSLVYGRDGGGYWKEPEEEGEEAKWKNTKTGKDAKRVWLKIDPPIPAGDTAAWDRIPKARKEVALVSFFSKQNKKMKCPSFALPAGSPKMGGTCVGATGAQTVALGVPGHEEVEISEEMIAEDHRKGMERVRLAETICSTCYASVATSAQHSSVQIEEMARYMYLRGLTKQQMIDVFQAALDAEIDAGWEVENGFRYFRIHDSGDFWGRGQPSAAGYFDYAEAWLEVCRRNPEIKFWAPTRTHVVKEWMQWWKTKAQIPENLAVRPSSYHFGDKAPGQKPGGGNEPIARNFAPGTCSLYAIPGTGEHKWDADAKKSHSDFVCPVYYAEGHDTANCVESIDPAGSKPCRACWDRVVTVNYTAHGLLWFFLPLAYAAIGLLV